MTNYEALLFVAAIVIGICYLTAGRVWRRCRCGAQYCNGCNARRGK